MSARPVDENQISLSQQLGDGIYYQPIEVEIEVTKEESGNVEYWLGKDIIVRRQQYTESDGLELMALPDPDENEDAIIEPGDGIVIRAGPESSIAEDGDRNMSNNDQTLATIFTGIISSARDTGNKVWKAFAFTYQLDVIKTEIDYSADEETNVNTIIEEILEEVKTVNGTDMEFNVDVSESKEVPYGETRLKPIGSFTKEIGGRKILFNEKVRQLKPYTDKRAGEILESLAKSTNSTLWVDSNNVVQFGPTKTALHKLSWIIDSSAGFQTPPYQSVRVLGDDIGTESANGWQSANMVPTIEELSETKVSLADDGDSFVYEFGELNEPTFTYEDESIRTREEARVVAKDLLDGLQSQRASGEIIIPGRPMVDIFDVVEMPPSFSTTKEGKEFPPAQYIVEKVVHRINPSDGFITEISVGGLVNRYVDKPYYKYTQVGDEGVAKMKLVQPGEVEEVGTETLGEVKNIPAGGL